MLRQSKLLLAITFALLICGSALSAEKPTAAAKKGTFRVVGYLPEYRMSGFDPEHASLLTDLVYFSAAPKASGDLNTETLTAPHLKLLRETSAKHNLRLLLCVGGWSHSKEFAPMAASAPARKRFAANVKSFCMKEMFNGVDIDWEHPANAKEQNDYALLLTELKQAFKGTKLTLSVAMAGWQRIPAEGLAALDFIHLMAYDDNGKHSTFEYAQSQLDKLIAEGIPASKICLGVPFYGRDVKSRDAQTYSELVARHKPGPDINEFGGTYFNGINLIQQKTKLALDRKAAGIMIWEIGQDTRDETSLLKAIRTTVDAK